jgi:hypothetical protein
MTLRGLVTIVGLVALAAAVYYVTAGRGREVCTVCLSYQARTRCPTASGRTAADAVDRARRSACDELTSTDSSRAACMVAPPASVQCRTR